MQMDFMIYMIKNKLKIHLLMIKRTMETATQRHLIYDDS